MSQTIAFTDALAAAEQLDPDAQAALVALLSRRLAERGRERVVATVAEARREFAAGHCQPMAPAEIVRERENDSYTAAVAGVWARPAQVAQISA